MFGKPMRMKDLGKLITATFKSWSDHNAPRLGAALSFYMLLSMAPLLIVMVTVCGLVISRAQAQHDLLNQVQAIAGPAAQRTMSMLITSVAQPKTGLLASAIALITGLFGASGVFMELRESLNTIWDVPKSTSGLKGMVWHRCVSVGMVLGLGLLFLTSLAITATLVVLESFFSAYVPPQLAVLGSVADVIIPLVAHTFLFGLIFKVIPKVTLAWRDALIGGFATAILFNIGRLLLGFYLGTLGVGSTYGAAGSLVAFIVWVYYSAQIFFFGAIFTKEYAERFGSRMQIGRRRSLSSSLRSGVNWMARGQGV